MIRATKTKTRGSLAVADRPVVRHGGGPSLEAVTEIAPTKQRRAKISLPTKAELPGQTTTRRKGVTEFASEEPIADPPKHKRGRSERPIDIEQFGAAPAETTGHARLALSANDAMRDHSADGELPRDDDTRIAVCRTLQTLQRQRVSAQKSRIMIENNLAATVATVMGYHAGMEEADRKARRAEASKLIACIDKGKPLPAGTEAVAASVSAIVQNAMIAKGGFEAFETGLEKEMERLIKSLPISAWIEGEDRRGIGLKQIAYIIGETGDLSNYSNPAKVWKRMGCAPFKGQMPSTWRRKGGLSAEDWTEIGYSPRRRAMIFVMGENIVKQNHGSYRKRYDEAKVAAKAKHEDWSDGRAHWHAMLLASKRLLRDLWREWKQVIG